MTRFEYTKTEDGWYVCPHCNERKRLISTMNMHYHAHHDGTFKHKCKHCNYETSAKQTLDNHILSKHPEHCTQVVQQMECPCQGCDYRSHKKAALRSHYILKHLNKEVAELCGCEAGSKSICCTVCGETFRSKPSFTYHVVSCLPPDLLQQTEVRQGLCL